jgi:hypothetical protein
MILPMTSRIAANNCSRTCLHPCASSQLSPGTRRVEQRCDRWCFTAFSLRLESIVRNWLSCSSDKVLLSPWSPPDKSQHRCAQKYALRDTLYGTHVRSAETERCEVALHKTARIEEVDRRNEAKRKEQTGEDRRHDFWP